MISLQGFYRSAQNRNRTCTPFRKPDFESSASTNSAIWAVEKTDLNQFLFSLGAQMYVIGIFHPKFDECIFSCSNMPLVFPGYQHP